jgi:hypothetical protein
MRDDAFRALEFRKLGPLGVGMEPDLGGRGHFMPV